MAVGGQGAPLVPLVDLLLFHTHQHTRLLLNIGGISNITVLDVTSDQTLQVPAFDLGPGNMLMDAAIVHFTQGAEKYDRDGACAKSGQIQHHVVDELMRHEFFQRAPPKSTGREEFGVQLLQHLLAKYPEMQVKENCLATLCHFTASAIISGLKQFVMVPQHDPKEMFVAGGGVHNATLMAALAVGLPSITVQSLAVLDADPDAREAVTFAVLANQTIHACAGNMVSATGAERAAVLGKIAVAALADEGHPY